MQVTGTEERNQCGCEDTAEEEEKYSADKEEEKGSDFEGEMDHGMHLSVRLMISLDWGFSKGPWAKDPVL
jgi:hypothetical protein